jgi:hypothetical protein
MSFGSRGPGGAASIGAVVVVGVVSVAVRSVDVVSTGVVSVAVAVVSIVVVSVGVVSARVDVVLVNAGLVAGTGRATRIVRVLTTVLTGPSPEDDRAPEPMAIPMTAPRMPPSAIPINRRVTGLRGCGTRSG